jgi:hypothetical protein
MFTTTATYRYSAEMPPETVCFHLGQALGLTGIKAVKIEPVTITETEVQIVFHHNGLSKASALALAPAP